MTEPENFEEDLFADLYDDDTPAKPAAAQQPAPPPAPVAVPQPSVETHAEPPPQSEPEYGGGGGDDQMKYEEEDDDDEVDFNLGGDGGGGGGGGSTGYAPPSNGFAGNKQEEPTYSTSTAKNPSAKEDGKMFIGGLNWETTDQSLRDYFSQFGEVVECTVMRDSSTGRSRGFGFLTFRDAKTVNIVMVKEHFLDGKIIDPKRAIPRDEQEKTSKIFVGGVSQDTTDQEFKDYFAQFGRVVDATLMMDKDTGRPRGFGFVTFESEAGVDACLSTSLEIHGKPIEVKKAQPRGNLREEEEAARRGGKFRKGEDGAQGGQGGMGGGQMGAAGGMTPQVMAQYFQRMQQYFAMMQQQMAMSRGMGPMNPAMMQQMMQMQQMQQMQNQMMGRGGGGNGQQGMMGQMTPQMMQQMQQMQQQMQQQMGQQGGPPSGPSGSFSPQQQMFDPSQGGQPPQQPGGGQGPRRGGSSGGGGAPRDQYNQAGAYAMGGGGGAPTSWEGMYDDVPQPNQGGRGGFRGGHRGGSHSGGSHQGSPDPAHAPPANAPTGPKNAGRPGANYRGGGRSSNRGFHPYSR
ncbi:nuclear polyadenylated RNA-binding protein [Colletotrichum scovillei]|uniref:Heterogeneous nuclear ribonucleoprotein HRP1 n=1 Tax=Colletotrichum scovillei TaxID=1209932 RepID=A0A9P7RFJ3_9PEZI|nr:nuclear polyadenylated RNA-binding protein [Colletotrichum scovillei]KAF4785981.1 nuclear polyadenylated RNA-binding protein [Colletotrichum scovillei]KAG7055244.1 putative heterogeneous nuclear ribonucleoprotein HRP1 [Colletotrichum scovillei]KAG7074689.1 putative heterogeneous nuclear ribonucleoprotein HRP1 [Colletotrichum scovillei]KAG7081928.1 putative heterogeneous nuclear ribonucleoprotein HRP1 [Colletotrichum scovillei]